MTEGKISAISYNGMITITNDGGSNSESKNPIILSYTKSMSPGFGSFSVARMLRLDVLETKSKKILTFPAPLPLPSAAFVCTFLVVLVF